MQMTIGAHFQFEAAHHLPHHPGKCKNPHGHSYKLEVEVAFDATNIDPKVGYLLDFSDLRERVNTLVIDVIDHRDLNLIFSDVATSAENIASWIFDRLTISSLNVTQVTLYETEDCYVTVRA